MLKDSERFRSQAVTALGERRHEMNRIAEITLEQHNKHAYARVSHCVGCSKLIRFSLGQQSDEQLHVAIFRICTVIHSSTPIGNSRAVSRFENING